MAKFQNNRIAKKIFASAEEQLKNQQIRDSLLLKFPKKTCKVEVVYKKQNSSQEYCSTGYYVDLDDAKVKANDMLDKLNKYSTNFKWHIVSIQQINLYEIADEQKNS